MGLLYVKHQNALYELSLNAANSHLRLSFGSLITPQMRKLRVREAK